jgi:large subunit ribosomal protein L17
MRHNRTNKKLGRTSAHRQALFRNQMASLIAHERIITTLAKAKAVRPLAERLVTQGKRNTIHARRLVGRYVSDRDLIKKLFDTIAPRFAQRPGGYLRIVRLGPRFGDGGERAVLEFVDYERPTKATESSAKSAEAK